MMCSVTKRIDGVLYECRNHGLHADDEHNFQVAPLSIAYQSISARTVADITSELNMDVTARRYSERQVKRAIWLMLEDLLDDFNNLAAQLADDQLTKKFSRNTFEKYLGTPELDPELTGTSCAVCHVAFTPETALLALDATPNEPSFQWVHRDCLNQFVEVAA